MNKKVREVIAGELVKVAKDLVAKNPNSLRGKKVLWGSPGYPMRGRINEVEKTSDGWEIIMDDDSFTTISDRDIKSLLRDGEISYKDVGGGGMYGAHGHIEIVASKVAKNLTAGGKNLTSDDKIINSSIKADNAYRIGGNTLKVWMTLNSTGRVGSDVKKLIDKQENFLKTFERDLKKMSSITGVSRDEVVVSGVRDGFIRFEGSLLAGFEGENIDAEVIVWLNRFNFKRI